MVDKCEIYLKYQQALTKTANQKCSNTGNNAKKVIENPFLTINCLTTMPSQTLLEKLQLTDEKNLLIQGLPSSIEKQFIKLTFSKSVTPLLKKRKIDFALVFAVNQRQLSGILKEVIPALNDEAKFWIAYPKLTSKIASDLSRNKSWDFVSEYGYEAVRMVALDPVWSANCFKRQETGGEEKL